MSDIQTIKLSLENYKDLSIQILDGYLSDIKLAKKMAVKENGEDLAKELWCYEKAVAIHLSYRNAFQNMKDRNFYDAWCLLEIANKDLHFLRKHFKEYYEIYGLNYIESTILKYRDIYPYKIFLSRENLNIEKKCNVCGAIINVRKSCGHNIGEIYGGEMCCREITKTKLLGMAFVENPLNVSCVPFPVNSKTGTKEDNYNYSVVAYLTERLGSPYEGWEFEWMTIRHPHEHYKFVGRNQPCPCGSGKKYKKCCLPTEGVLRPHCEFHFSEPKTKELLRIEYSVNYTSD